MNLRNFANKTVDFITDRLKELIGLTLSIISVLIAISLLSYSPEDPNFIYSENIEIKSDLESEQSQEEMNQESKPTKIIIKNGRLC